MALREGTFPIVARELTFLSLFFCRLPTFVQRSEAL